MPLPAAYLGAVRQHSCRVALAQLRTGSHWLAEETGRWKWVPRAQRTCPHCQGGLEDVQPVLFACLVLQLSADPQGKNMCPRIFKFNVLFYWHAPELRQ